MNAPAVKAKAKAKAKANGERGKKDADEEPPAAPVTSTTGPASMDDINKMIGASMTTLLSALKGKGKGEGKKGKTDKAAKPPGKGKAKGKDWSWGFLNCQREVLLHSGRKVAL